MILMKDIIREGDPVLQNKAAKVKFPLSDTDRETINQMMEYLRNSQNPETAEELGLRAGVGLAAPQINISKQIIAVRLPEGEEYELFNPEITKHSKNIIYIGGGEGCLSVDRDIEGIVPRYESVEITAKDAEGKKIRFTADDYLGIVFQHEIDHLNGILFIDRISETDPMTPPDGAIEI